MAIPGSLLSAAHVVHLKSERLVMRRFTVEDDELLVELDSDPEVVKHVGGVPSTLARIREEVIPRVVGYYDTLVDGGVWATHEIATGAFIGWFHYRPDRAPPHDQELGYRLRRAAWGKGYATEMSRVILTHAFEALRHPRVIAHAEKANTKSWHVMEKLGMTRELERQESGVPVVQYGISREAWSRRSA
ncbi:MAG: GNAT family N-acetyltransferase [Labilithrix sp.]|nr:GNAT family N-acetyltransferase [Labilithrix sp.]